MSDSKSLDGEALGKSWSKGSTAVLARRVWDILVWVAMVRWLGLGKGR